MQHHIPVLLQEVIENLAIKRDGVYIDGTFGRGGHTRAILQQLNDHGRVIAIDRDPSAIAVAREINDPRLQLCQAPFSEIQRIATANDINGKVDGILLDLGVSSPQLDDPARGFSFQHDGPLDMRMNPNAGESVAEWLAHVDETTLANVLFTYGEERFARRIAAAIIRARVETPLTSTRQLAEIVAAANPKWEAHKHAATRSFQALRIFINSELDELKQCLAQCIEVLGNSGRLVVISFHSLEDRLVKEFIREPIALPNIPRGLPLTKEQLSRYEPPLQSVGKAIKPSEAEMKSNPRSRSAMMRVAQKGVN